MVGGAPRAAPDPLRSAGLLRRRFAIQLVPWTVLGRPSRKPLILHDPERPAREVQHGRLFTAPASAAFQLEARVLLQFEKCELLGGLRIS